MISPACLARSDKSLALSRNSFSHWLNFACRFGELTSVFAAALYFLRAVDMSLNLSAMEAVRASSIEDFRAFSFVSRSFARSSVSEYLPSRSAFSRAVRHLSAAVEIGWKLWREFEI